jgi:CRP-like cAMP-binding protein
LLLHNLEFAALTICWCTFWAGLLFFLGHTKANTISTNVKQMTTVIVVGVNVIFMVRGFYIFVREYLRDRKIAKRRRLTAIQNGAAVPSPSTEQSSVRIVPKEDATVVSVAAAALDDDLDHEQHANNVIDEHHGHEERLNALHLKQSKRAKRNTQLRLLERSKVKSLKTLAQVPGFSQMTEAKMSKMVDNMKLIKYQPGDVICQEGDAANCFYVILEGNCAITSLRHGKRRMATIGEYDFFGESMMTTNVAFRTRVATVTVVPEDEENEDMKNKSRHGAQVLVLERNQYDALCSGGGIDLSETINESIEVIAKQRKSENRENLLAGRAMNRLRSMRKEMGGEVKTKDKKKTAEVKQLKQNDFTFKDL